MPLTHSHEYLHIRRSINTAYTTVLIERKIKNLQPTTDFKQIKGNTMK